MKGKKIERNEKQRTKHLKEPKEHTKHNEQKTCKNEEIFDVTKENVTLHQITRFRENSLGGN